MRKFPQASPDILTYKETPPDTYPFSPHFLFSEIKKLAHKGYKKIRTPPNLIDYLHVIIKSKQYTHKDNSHIVKANSNLIDFI